MQDYRLTQTQSRSLTESAAWLHLGRAQPVNGSICDQEGALILVKHRCYSRPLITHLAMHHLQDRVPMMVLPVGSW